MLSGLTLRLRISKEPLRFAAAPTSVCARPRSVRFTKTFPPPEGPIIRASPPSKERGFTSTRIVEKNNGYKKKKIKKNTDRKRKKGEECRICPPDFPSFARMCRSPTCESFQLLRANEKRRGGVGVSVFFFPLLPSFS